MFKAIWLWLLSVVRGRNNHPNKSDNDHVVHVTKPFSPLKQCRWLLEIDAIDPFLVTAAKLPKVKPGARKGLGPIISTMTIEFVNTNSGGLNGKLLEWFELGNRRETHLKLLDNDGIVRETWSMMLAPVEFKCTDLNYAESKHVITTVTVQPFGLKIKGTHVNIK